MLLDVRAWCVFPYGNSGFNQGQVCESLGEVTEHLGSFHMVFFGEQPDREAGVTNPAISIVPVSRAARSFRQRRCGRCRDGSRWRVEKTFEHDCGTPHELRIRTQDSAQTRPCFPRKTSIKFLKSVSVSKATNKYQRPWREKPQRAMKVLGIDQHSVASPRR